ncbi:MAG: oligosaccharide flippase family protein [Ignavibacteria bacterium]|nr:oligosaccharide flippase family protein [Ignavibacteria bacterium]
MKALVISSAYIGSSEAALIFIALIRNKYLAEHIGPAGFGVYGLLNSFFAMAAVIGGAWLVTGNSKYIAEYFKKSDLISVRKTHNFSLSLTLIISTFLTFIFFIFHNSILRAFLSEEVLLSYFFLFSAAFVGTSLRSILTSILQGLVLIKEVVFLRIVSTLFDFISVLSLVYFFDLLGFFISLLISSIFALLLFFFRINKYTKIQIIIPNFKDDVSKKIANFGFVNLFLAFINLGSQYLQRYIILINLGMPFVGLFQAAYSLMNYLGIVNRGTLFYYIPKMSEELNIVERNKMLNDYLRFTIFTGLPIALFAIIFSEFAIKTLYSKSFLTLGNIFFVFVIAQFIISIEYAVQSILVGTTSLKMHSVVTIITHFIWIAVPFFYIKELGLISIGLSLAVASLIAITIDYIFLYHSYGIRILKRNLLMFLASIIILLSSTYIKEYNLLINILFGVAGSAIILVNIKKEEIVLIRSLFLQKLFKPYSSK